MTPSIPASTYLASCAVPQAAFASYSVTQSRHFAMNWRHVSPMPTGLIPGCFSSAINRPLINALYSSYPPPPPIVQPLCEVAYNQPQLSTLRLEPQ